MTSTGPVAPGRPDVTVVVICFDDAARLPRAVASVQRQTLRNLEIVIVDDASTDDTEAVARRIAADDPRVRYERLERNSGGCSAPRNRGMDLARADWVMFCDSDDEYERHACKNLLLAAERTGADVVCGTAVRIDTASGRTRRWRPELHDTERVADGLDELPDLLYDTISVNKIYRADLLRSNAIRFPEGILFEDQLFTLQAMAAATRLAVIPQTVYRWHVDRLADDLSITQRRGETRNVDSRIEVNRRIDRFLDGRGLTALRSVKDEKFLRHDLYLYLSSMVEADDETARALVDRLAPYVEQVPLESAWRLRPALRVAVYHLLRRDLAGIRSAMRFLAWASSVDATITSAQGRDRWEAQGATEAGGTDGSDDEAVAGFPAADWLDVTDLRLTRVPFSQRRFLHRIDELTTCREGVLRVRGRTRDYDGSLRASDAPELWFILGGQAAATLPLAWAGPGPTGRPGWCAWSAEAALRPGFAAPLPPQAAGVVAVAVRRGHPAGSADDDGRDGGDGIVNVTPARSERDACPREAVRFPGAVRATGPDTLRCGPGDNGAIDWRGEVGSPRRRRLAGLVATWHRLPGSARLATVADLVRRDWLRAVAGRIARALPRRDLAVLQAREGRWCGGDVAAVAAALARRHAGVRRVWAVREAPQPVPAGSEHVVRGSVRHAWLLGRARWVVGDGEGEGPAGLRPDAIAVDVGPGVPVRRLGLDDPSLLTQRAAAATLRRSGRRTSVLLAASQPAADLIGPALAVRGRVAAVGLPALDDAIAARAGDPARLRGALDLPADRAVVVYAPVRREPQRATDLLDLDAWADRLGERAYLVACSPPGAPIDVPTRLRWAVRSVPASVDPAPFLGAADLVVADYGRAVGDAALLDIPLVLFWPDRATYVDRAHGVYPHAHDLAPVVAAPAELLACVGDWLDDPQGWAGRYGAVQRSWARTWCGPADGAGADRAATALLGGDP